MSVDNSYVIEETQTKEELDKIINDLTEEVNRLYIFRDHYFENHPLEKAVNKDSDVREKLDVAISSFTKCEESKINDLIKAKFLYLKGKALNVLPKFDQKAEQALSKAVKLNPDLVDAWNELGECYWKDSNLPEAKNCFSGALPHRRNKISLRNLSIVLRQEVSLTPQERHKNIEKSVELAKEALQLDPMDGVSWCILGNAYLSSFFVVAQDPAILKLSMNSYKQALSDPVARGQSDLHYNRAVALMYEEEFFAALESFTKAIAIDPTWEDPTTEKQMLVTYLDDLSDLIRTRGKIKGKKLQQMMQQLLCSKHLGPYADGQYTSGIHSIKLQLTPLSQLKAEINPEIVILGKVVCSIRNERTVPFTFCIVDAEGTCVGVTVYNLADGKGVIIGDYIAIPEPFVTHHSFTHNKEYKFSSIRVDNPTVMVVNGKKIGRDQMAGTKLTSYYRVS